ncbi:MAG: Tim44/TimA family putative adaptor protein [Hyphomicrobium sp.]
MDGQIDVFTLLTLVVAIVAIFKLRSVLGRRTGDEESRIEQRARETSAARAEQASGQDKVVTLRRDRDRPVPQTNLEPVENEAQERIKALGGDTALSQGLLNILKADPDFHPDQFINGAKQAYELIVTAFADGNRRALKDLLGPNVIDEFTNAIAEREKRGEKLQQTFVGLNRADILDAETVKGTAQITMRFVSELISATRDRAGAVIEGDPGQVKTVTDIWTFSRDVSTASARRNLNWKLIATEPLN